MQLVKLQQSKQSWMSLEQLGKLACNFEPAIEIQNNPIMLSLKCSDTCSIWKRHWIEMFLTSVTRLNAIPLLKSIL